MYSTQAFMLGYCRSRSRASPYTTYIVQGMITAASAQAAEPPANAAAELSTSGITCGTLPFGFWSAATSPSHLAKKPATSMLKAAVRANTWASPVQPSRSSRCGQSVGTSRKLPFWPQTMLC